MRFFPGVALPESWSSDHPDLLVRLLILWRDGAAATKDGHLGEPRVTEGPGEMLAVAARARRSSRIHARPTRCDIMDSDNAAHLGVDTRSLSGRLRPVEQELSVRPMRWRISLAWWRCRNRFQALISVREP